MEHFEGLELKNYKLEHYQNNSDSEILTLKNANGIDHVSYILYRRQSTALHDYPVLVISGSFGEYMFNFKNAYGALASAHNNFKTLNAISKMNINELSNANSGNSKYLHGLISFSRDNVLNGLNKYLDKCGVSRHKYSKIIREHDEWRTYYKRRDDFVQALSWAFDYSRGFSKERLLSLRHGQIMNAMLEDFNDSYRMQKGEPVRYYVSHLFKVGRDYDMQAVMVLRLLKIGLRYAFNYGIDYAK